jgi:hypothetical protein
MRNTDAPMRVLTVAISVAAALSAVRMSPAQAQILPGRPVAHPRIEVNPRPLLYRRCKSWYELQHRPSGTVLFPQRHCWWVKG